MGLLFSSRKNCVDPLARPMRERGRPEIKNEMALSEGTVITNELDPWDADAVTKAVSPAPYMKQSA